MFSKATPFFFLRESLGIFVCGAELISTDYGDDVIANDFESMMITVKKIQKKKRFFIFVIEYQKKDGEGSNPSRSFCFGFGVRQHGFIL